MQPIHRASPFVLGALLAAGALFPLLLLLSVAFIFPRPPLTLGEQYQVLNPQQLGYGNLGLVCRPGLRFPRAPNELTVFGGSSVAGAFATAGQDFTSQLHRRLQARHHGKWAAHNLGLNAKSSYFVKECMRVAAPYGAKIWVVYEGHNDFINMFGPGPTKTRFFFEHPALLPWMEWALASGPAGFLRPWLNRPPGTGESARLDRDVARILEISERNYRAMVAMARANHAHLVLATVISNLLMEPIGDIDPLHPERPPATVYFARAERAFAAGDRAEALRLYRLARDRDPRMFRAPSGFNELMRRLAAEFPADVTLVDLERDFEREFGNEKLGCQFFGDATRCDWVHPNDRTHAWIAARLEAKLEPLLERFGEATGPR